MKARHAGVLLGKAPSIGELVPALSMVGERLSRTLSAALGRLSGNDAPIVRVGMPMDGTLGSLQGEIEGLAAHTLLAMGPAGRPLLATFEAVHLFRLVDRAFGGAGLVPDPPPESLPLSAELLLARIEECLCAALTTALETPQTLGTGERRLRVLRRDTSLRQLDPFPPSDELLMLSLEIEEPGADPWSFQLAFPIPTLAAAIEVPRHPVQRRIRLCAPDPGVEPFASIPLEVTAVLVDMALAMNRVASLRPGDVLPVAVARSVPLQIDGRTIATGTIGELDDRVAVQIAQAY